MSTGAAAVLAGDRFDAVLFDLDGVLTDTAPMHADCWKRTLDAFLQRRAAATGRPARPFDAATDYRLHLDGKPRLDGVRDFLRSRSIELPEGDAGEPAEADTVHGLAARKNGLVAEAIARGEAVPFTGAVELVRGLRDRGIATAVVSSSRNCAAILEAAAIAALFDARVDGVTAAEAGLPGKPDPATYLEAARRLGVPPGRAAVIEDAIAGVRAGRAGGFALVIGIATGDAATELREHGADIVVASLEELESP